MAAKLKTLDENEVMKTLQCFLCKIFQKVLKNSVKNTPPYVNLQMELIYFLKHNYKQIVIDIVSKTEDIGLLMTFIYVYLLSDIE